MLIEFVGVVQGVDSFSALMQKVHLLSVPVYDCQSDPRIRTVKVTLFVLLTLCNTQYQKTATRRGSSICFDGVSSYFSGWIISGGVSVGERIPGEAPYLDFYFLAKKELFNLTFSPSVGGISLLTQHLQMSSLSNLLCQTDRS